MTKQELTLVLVFAAGMIISGPCRAEESKNNVQEYSTIGPTAGVPICKNDFCLSLHSKADKDQRVVADVRVKDGVPYKFRLHNTTILGNSISVLVRNLGEPQKINDGALSFDFLSSDQEAVTLLIKEANGICTDYKVVGTLITHSHWKHLDPEKNNVD